MKHYIKSIYRSFFLITGLFLASANSCLEDSDADPQPDNNSSEAVFLLIDDDSIDNGNEPNDFSATDVNDQLADIGLRIPLKYFKDNVGKTIELYTGEVGDEGWFALKTIPSSWASAGPTTDGLKNYLVPGPRLGAPIPDDDREVLLDKIPNVTPLRATGLSMLKGKTVYAVVYDSDISINYSPLNGNLMGSNLGVVAFDVLEVRKRTDGSSGSLPRVTIKIRNTDQVSAKTLVLLASSPVPTSSSEPFDVEP
ncbi:MAG: hypothetical protein U5K79_05840 [Cyclobacteriaceae bacterium]|nr:hypothetical protein [Cyclobacteriaceae bacterium]